MWVIPTIRYYFIIEPIYDNLSPFDWRVKQEIMVQLLRISEETSLEGLERDFQLQRNDDRDFFREWRQEWVNLSQGDREALKRITEFYKNISRKSVVSENIVKMAILSPLLDLAGFYSSQFAIADEESITV